MQKKNYKGRCEKRKLAKAKGVCRFYSDIQAKYGALLDMDASIVEIECNRLMDGFTLGEYTCDFLCKKVDGDLMVRECVQRKFLVKPMTMHQGCIGSSVVRGIGERGWHGCLRMSLCDTRVVSIVYWSLRGIVSS